MPSPIDYLKGIGGNSNMARMQINLLERKTPEEIQAASMISSGEAVNNGSMGGAIAGGLLKGMGIYQQGKALTEKEKRMAALQEYVNYQMETEKYQNEALQAQAKVQAAKDEATANQGSLDNGVVGYFQTNDPSRIGEVVKTMPAIKAQIQLHAPEGSVFTDRFINGANGELLPVFQKPDGGMAYGESFRPETYLSVDGRKSLTDFQKSQADLANTQAKTVAVLAGGNRVAKPAKGAQSPMVLHNSYTTAHSKMANIIAKIDKAIPEANAGTTGFIGSLASQIGGTKSYDLKETLATIKANLGFEELAAMRENSPTGGALGNVTEKEIAYLQSVKASLEIAQSTGQLKDNLANIREQILGSWKRIDAAYKESRGDLPAQDPQQAQEVTPQAGGGTIDLEALKAELQRRGGL